MKKKFRKNWHLFVLGLSIVFYFIVKYFVYDDKKDNTNLLKMLDKKSKTEQKKIVKINKELKEIENKKVTKEKLKDNDRASLLGIIRRNRKRTNKQ